MALKDLVADKKKITEEAIEGIVSSYVRYDPNDKDVIFTPDGSSLPGEKRLLVYLVALFGWQYIVDDVPEMETKPAQLGRALGIAGGTLRPMLKKLSDNHLLTKKDGYYTVQVTNLDTIAGIIAGTKNVASSKSKPNKNKKAGEPQGTAGKASASSKAKSGTAKAGSQLGPVLSGWVADGFFSEPRTLADVQQRFHEKAIIVKQTSLSGLLLKAVRNDQLKREKAEVNGKDVWIYSI